MSTEKSIADKLVEFIEENKIEIKDGYRNHPLTVLCGYAQHIDAEEKDVFEALEKTSMDNEANLTEAERVFWYAHCAGYGEWWNTEEAKSEYIF